MDLVCSWGFLSFSFSWQRLKLWVISEHRAFGDLGIFGTTPGSLSDRVVSENSEQQRRQLSICLAFSQPIVYMWKGQIISQSAMGLAS